ncbi:MAG: hypothetical protein WCE63_05020 [Acidobacteriaceae bacterium]
MATKTETTEKTLTDEQIKSWIKIHRAAYAAGTLPAYKIARIERIPGWTWTDEAPE